MSKSGVVAHILLTEHFKKNCLGCGSLDSKEEGKVFGLLIDLRIGLSGMQFFVCESCLEMFLEKIRELKAKKKADEVGK